MPAPHLYYVEVAIPEIEANVGDLVLDCPANGLCLIRRGVSRAVVLGRWASLRRLPLPVAGAGSFPPPVPIPVTEIH